MVQILPNRDVAIQITNIEKVKKLRKRDNFIKVLGSKAKFIQKQCGIVAFGISLAKTNFEKIKESKEKLVTQNINMRTSMKIESFFWLSPRKKYKEIASLKIEIDNVKMANLLIKQRHVLDYTLHRYIRYNSACKRKPYFKCYEYNYILIHCRKETRCEACLSSYKILNCPQNKEQECLLYNSTHIFWDKQCKHKKKKYLRIEVVKQNIPRLYNTSF